MEKLIKEFKVIETDDGYRIEIKGNKEHFERMFSRKGWSRWARRRHRHGFGFPFGFGPLFWAHVAHCYDPWDMREEHPEEDQEEKSED